MRIFSKKPKTDARAPAPPSDIQSVLNRYQQQIAQIAAAILSGDANSDLKLAQLLDNVPQQEREAMMEKLQQMVTKADAAKATMLEQMIEQQRAQSHAQEKQVAQHWLAYFMSQETLRKIRESFMGSPGLKAQVEALGQDLAKKGVIGNLQMNQKQDLGELSSTINYNQNRQTGKDNGKGR